MASCLAPISISGGSALKSSQLSSAQKSNPLLKPATLALPSRKSYRNSNLSVSAKYNDGGRSGGGNDFVAGFLLGGAVFGTLAYVFAPQIRRTILNEDEMGFRRARKPIYYEEEDGLEKTRQILDAKIGQLSSAIDKVSSRLRGGNKIPKVPVEVDPDLEASF